MRKYNYDILEKNAEERPDGVPLVTVCNHTSCLDDPCLWGKRIFVTKCFRSSGVSLNKIKINHRVCLPFIHNTNCAPLFIVEYGITEHNHYGNFLVKEVTKQKKGQVVKMYSMGFVQHGMYCSADGITFAAYRAPLINCKHDSKFKCKINVKHKSSVLIS